MSTSSYRPTDSRAGRARSPTSRKSSAYAIAFAYQGLPSSRRVAVLTNAGGPGIMATDEIERQGLELAKIDPPDLQIGPDPQADAAKQRREDIVHIDRRNRSTVRHRQAETMLFAVLLKVEHTPLGRVDVFERERANRLAHGVMLPFRFRHDKRVRRHNARATEIVDAFFPEAWYCVDA